MKKAKMLSCLGKIFILMGSICLMLHLQVDVAKTFGQTFPIHLFNDTNTEVTSPLKEVTFQKDEQIYLAIPDNFKIFETQGVDSFCTLYVASFFIRNMTNIDLNTQQLAQLEKSEKGRNYLDPDKGQYFYGHPLEVVMNKCGFTLDTRDGVRILAKDANFIQKIKEKIDQKEAIALTVSAKVDFLVWKAGPFSHSEAIIGYTSKGRFLVWNPWEKQVLVVTKEELLDDFTETVEGVGTMTQHALYISAYQYQY